MIKQCSRCGGTFDLHGRAKYCVSCRREVKNEYNRRYWHTTEAYLLVERVRRCKICGEEFEAKSNAKYCPACRKDAYREITRECQRRYYAARRGDKTVKPKISPQERRIAYLRKKLTHATTPSERSNYFRQYVLLKQKLSCEQMTESI